MNRRHGFRRVWWTAGVGAVLATMLALPAAATPRDVDGTHKITICHVTNSQTNPYVVIEIDVAAFDGEGKNDHTQHASRDGRVDVPYVDGQCQVVVTTDPPPINL